MRPFLSTVFLASNILILSMPARADQESCASCDRVVQADGDFQHYKCAPNLAIQGSTPQDTAAFHEEVNGDHFTITISRLPAGKLTVIIGETETYFQQTGER
jgi:hypothetical protein